IREGGSIRCGHRFLLLEHNKEAEKCYRLLPPTAWKASGRALDSKAHFLRHRRARRFATSAANPEKCRSAIAYVTTSRLRHNSSIDYALRASKTCPSLLIWGVFSSHHLDAERGVASRGARLVTVRRRGSASRPPAATAG